MVLGKSITSCWRPLLISLLRNLELKRGQVKVQRKLETCWEKVLAHLGWAEWTWYLVNIRVISHEPHVFVCPTTPSLYWDSGHQVLVSQVQTLNPYFLRISKVLDGYMTEAGNRSILVSMNSGTRDESDCVSHSVLGDSRPKRCQGGRLSFPFP